MESKLRGWEKSRYPRYYDSCTGRYQCNSLRLKGRIEYFMNQIRKMFVFLISPLACRRAQDHFYRLRITRPEIVTFETSINPNKAVGKYVEPKDQPAIRDPNAVLSIRNEYEVLEHSRVRRTHQTHSGNGPNMLKTNEGITKSKKTLISTVVFGANGLVPSSGKWFDSLSSQRWHSQLPRKNCSRGK